MYSLEKFMKISSLANDFKGGPREKDLHEVFYRIKTFNMSYIDILTQKYRKFLKKKWKRYSTERTPSTASLYALYRKGLEKVFLRSFQKKKRYYEFYRKKVFTRYSIEKISSKSRLYFSVEKYLEKVFYRIKTFDWSL